MEYGKWQRLQLGKQYLYQLLWKFPAQNIEG